MPVAACPSAEVLAAFIRGDLPGPECAGVESHVGACAACCRALRGVPDGSLAVLAREAAAAPATLEPGLTPAPFSPGPPDAAPSLVNGLPAALANHPRYRILSELGRGGMGTVYKAEDTWMARIVALKVVSAHLTARATALARFRKEVHAAAQLTHQNIVRAYDTGEVGGSQFLVMEYVEGMSLDKLMAKRGRLSVPFACVLIRQAALGLQHAADKGMVHRDIKPHNLLVISKGQSKGQVKIADFGLARFAAGDGSGADASAAKVPFGAAKMLPPAVPMGVTSPNSVMGTPDYLSPEQFRNASGVDPRSDIYSLGCTLYYLLTGRPPFAGTTSLLDKLAAHAGDEPPAVRLERLEVTEELAGVIAKMMAKKPEDRFQTAAEVAAALLPYTRTGAAKEPALEVVETPPPPVAPIAEVVSPPRPKVKPVVADTAPGDDERTEADEPVRPRRRKKRRASWWERNSGKVVAASAALIAVAAVVAAVAFGVSKLRHSDLWTAAPAPTTNAGPAAPPAAGGDVGDKPDKGDDKPAPSVPPTAIVPSKPAARVLFVLPPSGLHRNDFEPVRAQLERRGAAVVTGAVEASAAKVDTGPDVPVQVRLTRTMNLSEYAAVVFVGSNADEYIGNGRGADEAKWLIGEMRKADKTVAAIGVGQAVLAFHGALNNKKAAMSEALFKKYNPLRNPWMSGGFPPRIKWDRQNTVTDGKTVTGAGEREREGSEFADAILRAVEGK